MILRLESGLVNCFSSSKRWIKLISLSRYRDGQKIELSYLILEYFLLICISYNILYDEEY